MNEELNYTRATLDQLQSNPPRSVSPLSQRSHHSDDKRNVSTLESKLKAQQENTKTMQVTLVETQNELESLINRHEKLNKECDQQLLEIQNLNDINNSNVKLIENLKEEQKTYIQEQSERQHRIKTLENQLRTCEKDLEHALDKQRQLEQHIHSLKQQENQRIENMVHKWESTVEDLSNELKNAHQEVEERQKILD